MSLNKDAITEFTAATITKGVLIDMAKLLMDKMMDSTYHFLLRNDADYIRAMESLKNAEDALREVEISKEGKVAFEAVIAGIDMANAENISMAYLAGIIDAYRILDNFGLIAE